MAERSHKLGLIGAGNMGAGLVRGAVSGGMLAKDQVVFYDPDPQRQEAMQTLLGTSAAAGNEAVVSQAEVVVVAVKPQVVGPVLSPLASLLSRDHLVISIAAGVRLHRLRELCGPHPTLVRVMPNILCTIGEGAAAYSTDEELDEAQTAFVEELLSSVGIVTHLEERLLDAVTGLSGSGPAFAAVFIGALIDGAVAAGLPREVATQLAAQTVRGTAQWVLEGAHPAQVKDAVTSPGGTTAAGLRVLERRGLRSAAAEAVAAAAYRSEQLGR